MRYKDKERLDVYLSRQEKDNLIKISKETGKSIAFLLLNGFAYWLKYSKQKIRFAKKFIAERELIEIKENRRKTGDFLGSFDKEAYTLEDLRKKYKKHKLPKSLYLTLVRQCARDYDRGRQIRAKQIKVGEQNEKT